MLRLPNYPSAMTPVGKDDSENVEQRRWGEPRTLSGSPKAHWDIGTDLNILDFDAAAKISGARFTVYRGLGARLERAVINFFMDTHAARRLHRGAAALHGHPQHHDRHGSAAQV